MIPAERSHLYVVARSHPGMSGKNNEDRFAVSAFRLSEEKPLPIALAIVADGIGGHRAGEVAAEIATNSITQTVAASDASQPVQTLKEAIIAANQAIAAQADADVEKHGMGATCACCWIIADRLYIAYVGDSRIYLIRNGNIQQLSVDHTWIHEAISAGIITTEQAKDHPGAHVIYRYLGSPRAVEGDFRLKLQADESREQSESNQGMRLLPNDQILLCSDGLTDLVRDDEILAAFTSKSQEQAVDDLIALANQRGGHDNITVISMKVPVGLRRPVTKPLEKPRKKKLGWPCLLVAAILLLIAAAAVVTYLYLNGWLPFLPPPGPSATIAPSQTILPSPTTTPSPTILPSITPSVTPLPSETVTPTIPPTPYP